MICSSCQTVYAPSAAELGKVETLAGLCEKCGTKPHFMPFAVAYIEGALGGLVSAEFLLLKYLSGTVQAAAALAGVVIIACVGMYFYARRSTTVRYRNQPQKNAVTWPHRLLGIVFGLGTVAATMAIIVSGAL